MLEPIVFEVVDFQTHIFFALLRLVKRKNCPATIRKRSHFRGVKWERCVLNLYYAMTCTGGELQVSIVGQLLLTI
jgi:hypothetical protein